jgi:hypothetical protein
MGLSKMALLRNVTNVDPRITLPRIATSLMTMALTKEGTTTTTMETPQVAILRLQAPLASGLLPKMVNLPPSSLMESCTTIVASAKGRRASGLEITLKLNTLMAT